MVRKVLGHYGRMIKRVFLSESRPACEGREAARFLSGRGIPVTYCTDATLPGYFSKADYFIIGADSVGKTHFVNKTGSAALLELAGKHGVTTVVVYESLKKTAGSGKAVRASNSESKVIWPGRRPDNIALNNKIFESIPLGLADIFISDVDSKI
jgi:translation initiation factor 2B subunit (eIF-2B alpha/beta/delta family)